MKYRDNVFRAIHYLDEHYTDKIRLEDVARLAGLSRTPFSVLFKKLTGKTLVEYLIHLRVNCAADLLRNQRELNITDVCFQSGFSDMRHFERCFKKSFGTNPRHYRENEG